MHYLFLSGELKLEIELLKRQNQNEDALVLLKHAIAFAHLAFYFFKVIHPNHHGTAPLISHWAKQILFASVLYRVDLNFGFFGWSEYYWISYQNLFAQEITLIYFVNEAACTLWLLSCFLLHLFNSSNSLVLSQLDCSVSNSIYSTSIKCVVNFTKLHERFVPSLHLVLQSWSSWPTHISL